MGTFEDLIADRIRTELKLPDGVIDLIRKERRREIYPDILPHEITLGIIGVGAVPRNFLRQLISERKGPDGAYFQKIKKIILIDIDQGLFKPASYITQLQSTVERDPVNSDLEIKVLNRNPNRLGYEEDNLFKSKEWKDKPELYEDNFSFNIKQMGKEPHVLLIAAGQRPRDEKGRPVRRVPDNEIINDNVRLFREKIAPVLDGSDATKLVLTNPCDWLAYASARYIPNVDISKIAAINQVDLIRPNDILLELLSEYHMKPKDHILKKFTRLEICGYHGEEVIVPLCSRSFLNGIYVADNPDILPPKIRKELYERVREFTKRLIAQTDNIDYPVFSIIDVMKAFLDNKSMVNLSSYVKLSDIPEFSKKLREDKGTFLARSHRITETGIPRAIDYLLRGIDPRRDLEKYGVYLTDPVSGKTLLTTEEEAIIKLYQDEAGKLAQQFGLDYIDLTPKIKEFESKREISAFGRAMDKARAQINPRDFKRLEETVESLKEEVGGLIRGVIEVRAEPELVVPSDLEVRLYAVDTRNPLQIDVCNPAKEKLIVDSFSLEGDKTNSSIKYLKIRDNLILGIIREGRGDESPLYSPFIFDLKTRKTKYFGPSGNELTSVDSIDNKIFVSVGDKIKEAFLAYDTKTGEQLRPYRGDSVRTSFIVAEKIYDEASILGIEDNRILRWPLTKHSSPDTLVSSNNKIGPPLRILDKEGSAIIVYSVPSNKECYIQRFDDLSRVPTTFYAYFGIFDINKRDNEVTLATINDEKKLEVRYYDGNQKLLKKEGKKPSEKSEDSFEKPRSIDIVDDIIIVNYGGFRFYVRENPRRSIFDINQENLNPDVYCFGTQK